MTAFFGKAGTGGLGDLFDQVAMFSASNLNQATIFGLGIMPYISASIIFQLLGSVYPPLEKLQKEGESGRKKINEYTRYATVVLCLGQSWIYMRFLMRQRLGLRAVLSTAAAVSWQFTGVMTMTAGTVFLMWLGEQIDEYGIGNGISLLIMAGILARMPFADLRRLDQADSAERAGTGRRRPRQHRRRNDAGVGVLFVAVVVGVVLITQGQRRIPTQSAKHVRGRRVYGGTRQYLPLRVNQAGVMPIIFASSLLLFPSVLFQYLANAYPSLAGTRSRTYSSRGDSWTYNVLYILLDLLLLLLLDRHFLQSEGHGGQPEELRHVYPRLSARPADGRLPGKSHGADHLRRRRLPGRGGHPPTLVSSWVGVNVRLGQFLRRHQPADRRQRGLRPGAEDRQPLVMRNYRGLLEKG